MKAPPWTATVAPFALWIVAFALILMAWQGAVWLSGLPPYVLPPPGIAFATLYERWRQLQRLAGQTLSETAAGYMLGAAIGFALALAMGQVRFVRRLVMPDSWGAAPGGRS